MVEAASLPCLLQGWGLEQRLLQAHNEGRHVVAADALAFPGVGRQAGIQHVSCDVRQLLPAGQASAVTPHALLLWAP